MADVVLLEAVGEARGIPLASTAVDALLDFVAGVARNRSPEGACGVCETCVQVAHVGRALRSEIRRFIS